MQLERGKVPNFKLRPNPVVMGLLVLIGLIGLLLAGSFFSRDDGSGAHRQIGIFILIVTALLCSLLGIIATSKFWFPHLWRKNSTHDRHKQHTQYHPSVRDRRARRDP